MKHVAVKFDDLLDAFDIVSSGQPMENEAYLCIETGAIYYRSDFGDDEEDPLPDDIEDGQKYIAIPHKNDLDLGKRLALRFADEFLPDVVDDVYDIFRGRGAYSRFKSLLEHRGKLQQWHEYEENSQKKALRQWCEESGIEVHD